MIRPRRLIKTAVLPALLCLTSSLLTGCGAGRSSSPASPEQTYTGFLVDSEQLTPGFLWQQEIKASRSVFSYSFSAAVQSADGVLTVLGLTPFHTRAFVIEQKGKTFEYRSFVDKELPLDPSWVLIDIHRTFFDAVPRTAPPDGRHTEIIRGERRTDWWQSGRLVKRTYERITVPGPVIHVDYGEGYRWGRPPPRVLFENGWHDYRLEVVTTSAEALPSESS